MPVLVADDGDEQFAVVGGVVVTGTTTGAPVRAADVGVVRGVGRLPTLLGSGLSVDGIDLLAASDGAIVGRSVRVDGVTMNLVDPARVRAPVAVVRAPEGTSTESWKPARSIRCDAMTNRAKRYGSDALAAVHETASDLHGESQWERGEKQPQGSLPTRDTRPR